MEQQAPCQRRPRTVLQGLRRPGHGDHLRRGRLVVAHLVQKVYRLSYQKDLKEETAGSHRHPELQRSHIQALQTFKSHRLFH